MMHVDPEEFGDFEKPEPKRTLWDIVADTTILWLPIALWIVIIWAAATVFNHAR